MTPSAWILFFLIWFACAAALAACWVWLNRKRKRRQQVIENDEQWIIAYARIRGKINRMAWVNLTTGEVEEMPVEDSEALLQNSFSL